MSSKKRYTHRQNVDVEVREPFVVTTEAVQRYFEALDCPKSLAASLLFKYGEHDQLTELAANPQDYNSSQEFRDAYLASTFLSKSTFLSCSFDKRVLAIEKFKKFESQCKETNLRFSAYNAAQRNEFHGHGALLCAMRRKIRKVLGEFCPLEMMDMASWGPGVSTLIKGEETHGSKKFQFETGITRDLYPLVKDLFPLAYPGWWQSLVEREGFPHFEVGNTVITVPKSSKIDRVIAVEPGLNLWFQLGIGSMISRRLARVGVNLHSQRRNQLLARKSSLDGSLATVDFSSASDSISSNLVRDLFSETRIWFDIMDVARSQFGYIDDSRFKWEKFSSMGNGFTFPLESLIFYAAAAVCCEKLQLPLQEVSVYGDDVIVPVGAYELFSSFSSFLGFTVNPVKSFSTGNFRESCGSHYWKGVSTKPLFLVDSLTSTQKVFNFANSLRIRFHFPYSPSGGFGCDARVRSLFYWLQKRVPKKYRFHVPATFNALSGEIEPLEGGFISNFDEASPSKERRGIEGYRFNRLAWVAVKQEVLYVGHLYARLYDLSTNESSDQEDSTTPAPLSVLLRVETLRIAAKTFLHLEPKATADGNSVSLRNVTRCLKVTGRTRRWYNLGPWI